MKVLLAGPTAVGKSAIALRLAERIHGEIVSVDSMQVYRGLDVGTAKPSLADRARVPHHLIDVVEPADRFDAAQFAALASAAISQIQSRRQFPILCGGTGLYFKAMFDGLGPAPASDPRLRAELAAQPLEILLAELGERDPATYARIDRRNPRRVLRAVEVLRLTGQPITPPRVLWAKPSRPPLTAGFCLTRAPDELRQRIDRRVEQMFRDGLVAETQDLLARGLAGNPIALQALGYRQVVEHLQGARSLAETIALVQARTRQYAKRQLTWFRRQMDLDWITLSPDQSDEATVELLATRILRVTSSGRRSAAESASPSAL